MRIFTWLFLSVSTLIFLSHYFLIGHSVYGDGRFYYSYARSLALQGNLDIKDELTHVFSPQDNNTNTQNQSQFSSYPVQSLGPALFWAPILFVAHQVSFFTGLYSNGFSDLYQLSAGLISIALSAYAFTRLGRAMRKSASPIIVFSVLLLVWAGTNLFFYTAIDNLNTHFFSFTLATLALCEYLDKKQPSLIITGILCGLAFQNRQLDVIYHLGLLLAFLSISKKYSKIIIFALTAFISALPQLFVWNFQFGSFWPPMAGSSFWHFSPAPLFSLFFSYPQGLLFTAPIILIALILLLYPSKNIYLQYSFYSFLIFAVIVSMWWSPFGGASYGPRFFITYYPMFATVLGAKLNHVSIRSLFIYSLIFVSLSLLQTFWFLYLNP